MAANTAPLPGGGTMYMLRLLALWCSVTFSYLEIV